MWHENLNFEDIFGLKDHESVVEDGLCSDYDAVTDAVGE
jgi:hypothetical protein